MSPERLCRYAADNQKLSQPFRRKVGIAKAARRIGETEEFGKMDQRAGALLASGHKKVVL